MVKMESYLWKGTELQPICCVPWANAVSFLTFHIHFLDSDNCRPERLKSSELLRGVSGNRNRMHSELGRDTWVHVLVVCVTLSKPLSFSGPLLIWLSSNTKAVCRAVGIDLHIYKALSVVYLTFAQQWWSILILADIEVQWAPRNWIEASIGVPSVY